MSGIYSPIFFRLGTATGLNRILPPYPDRPAAVGVLPMAISSPAALSAPGNAAGPAAGRQLVEDVNADPDPDGFEAKPGADGQAAMITGAGGGDTVDDIVLIDDSIRRFAQNVRASEQVGSIPLNTRQWMAA